MAVKMLKNMLAVAGLGLCIQTTSLAAEPGSVATISGAEGTVMVDRGKGFVSSKVGEKLFEKDRVITLDGSLAEVTFTDGCRTKLKSNNLIVISIDPGCKAAILDATKAQPGTAVAGGTHPGSYIPALGGVAILYYVLSAETNGFGSYNQNDNH